MKQTLITIGVVAILIIGCIVMWNKTAYRDVKLLKIESPKFIQERGFKITSYDGFEGSMIYGGFCWYQVRDSSNYLYKMAISEWKGVLMLYNQTCLNAVKNSK